MVRKVAYECQAVDAEEKWVMTTAMGVQFKSLDEGRAWANLPATK